MPEQEADAESDPELEAGRHDPGSYGSGRALVDLAEHRLRKTLTRRDRELIAALNDEAART